MKSTALSILAAAVIIAAAIIYSGVSSVDSVPAKDNMSVVDGKQIIELRAKGGYAPRKSIAKAGVPTILRVNTNGTFDCSIAVRIPSMGISKNLQPTGVADIDLGSPAPGRLQGTCAMGMYPFEIDFEG